uniref:Transcriptional regulator, Crp/Fnr family n=1 Tax=uncultured Thiotrichaceae bacterium TaxID=298394 RepID=A0A6S6TIP2_9GAMM|nr:MAG: transcriptional regulator, Crp/Fnr family [uncultured Thiotrichaceae bacterium]
MNVLNKYPRVECGNCSLSAFCLPQGLTKSELEQMELAIERTIKFSKKEYLFRRGDAQLAIYAVKSGAVKVSVSTAEGEEQILGFYLPGDLLGFDAMAKGEHICDAQALDDTLVCELKMDSLDELCSRFSTLRQQMMRQMGQEIERDHKLLLSLGQMRTEERLATFLIGISERNKLRGFAALEFNLPMPRIYLASYLGMAVETLSRMFSRLQSDGIIKVRQRLVVIEDIDALRNLAHRSWVESETL